jgi:hypothetical protein
VKKKGVEEQVTETVQADAFEREQMIARRAYELSQSAEAASDEENWLRAERELQAAAE